MQTLIAADTAVTARWIPVILFVLLAFKPNFHAKSNQKPPTGRLLYVV